MDFIQQILFVLLNIFNGIIIIYFILLNSFYLLTSVISFRTLKSYAFRLKAISIEDLIKDAGAPPVTLIAPAYNEEPTCVESTKALLTLSYPEYEILVINDGSKDNTLTTLINAFEMFPVKRARVSHIASANVNGIYRSSYHPNLWLIDKENGGKADALNTGLNYCRTPLFCAMDADSILERDSLLRIVRPFLEDTHTVAAGGIIRIVNDCTIKHGNVTQIRMPKNWLAKFQVLEYLRAFLSGRMGWSTMQATLIISGAFGIFKRGLVVDAGGYYTDTVGEDMELIVKLHRHCREKKLKYAIHFIPDPVAWTECPESIKILGRQRDRWQRGLYEVLTRHKKMLLNPSYGRIGLLAYPYFFFLEALGPLIEFPGYFIFIFALVMDMVSYPFMAAFFAVALIFGIALSIFSVAMEELTFRRYPKMSDLFQLFALSFIENFGYRQLNIYWRIHGMFSAFRKVKGWGQMERKGFNVQT